MPRKVIIDCDPGIDDAMAICLALFDPRLEVVAVTATAGTVDGQQTSRNVQTILEMLDPPRWPRIGVARSDESPVTLDARDLHGSDGLGNLGVRISELHHQHPADKVIADEVRNAPGQVSIVCLGPLTNLARVIGADPDLATMIDQVHIAGGSVGGIGNVTATAEFNFLCDPTSARTVVRSPITKTLVPLDLTSRLVFTLDFLDQLPAEDSRAGQVIRRLLPYLYRSSRQILGLEGIHLHDTLTMLYAVHSELFETVEMAGDVEVAGELTAGMTVFDRRPRRAWRINMEVAMSGDLAELQEALLRGLRFAAQETRD
jgi:inosine-uridine nucleoside N-ribohydrolase